MKIIIGFLTAVALVLLAGCANPGSHSNVAMGGAGHSTLGGFASGHGAAQGNPLDYRETISDPGPF